MEGHERTAVEARIRCLRNIQVLLDAAVMEMQQYSAVVARNTTHIPATASTSASSSSATTASTESATSESSTAVSSTTVITDSSTTTAVSSSTAASTTASSPSASSGTLGTPSETGARPKTSSP